MTFDSNQTHLLKRSTVLTLAGAIVGIFIAGPALSAELPASIKALIPEAQKEGAAMVWGITLNQRQIAAMNKAFNKFYGTNIKITHRGGAHGVKAVEIVRAYRSGVPTGVDVFWTAAPAPVIKAGALLKVDWHKEFGLDSALQMSKYGLTTHNSTSTMILVNSDLVKVSEEPRSYEDLLDPKWKGKIAITRSPLTWMQMSFGLGEAKAEALLVGLLTKQNVRILPSVMDVRARILSGEFAVGMSADAFKEIEKGAPIRHANMDTLILNTAGAWILKDSKAINVAKIWAYWAVSPQGQATIHKVRGFSLVTSKGTDINRYSQGRKTYVMPAEWRLKNQRRLVKKFANILRNYTNR